ncbi:hypothetical protein [Actinomadura algeriensis]|uniref:DUF308 domain-containing protein n=1 Tax=Actinomadura algeriensis TaxID=1679523 RepID=A0ABR9JX66_9ACTN|nr:hypothetical protein [Actinomadura algeriensis]MBE1535165.1 hypothetical protein [Actinomadura algeriensis]
MNRRGNGLSADTYAPLVDLAPHLADAMLTALRDAGVAAYAVPPAGGTGAADDPAPAPGGTDGGTPRSAADASGRAAEDVLDRLYVDVEMKPAAEGILRAHLARLRDAGVRGSDPDADRTDAALTDPALTESPLTDAPLTDAGRTEPPRPEPARPDPAASDGPDGPGAADASPAGTAERDEDAIWAEIVAGFDAVPEGDEMPWPDQENIDEPPEPPAEGDDRTGRLPRARVIKPAAEPDFPAEDDDGHYVPPPPPPLPAADPLTKGAWVALVGGPVYLLITVILDWEVPGWAAFLAVAAFIGGFVTLVLRMGDEPRDGDDGAVV